MSHSDFWYYEYLLCLALGRFNTPSDEVFEQLDELIFDSIDRADRDSQVGEFIEISLTEASVVLFKGLVEANPNRTLNECSLLVELFMADISDSLERQQMDELLKNGYASRA